jgi:hypothetical protein
MNTDRSVFTDDVHQNKLANLEPQCMRDRPVCNSGAKHLTEEEMEVAKKELINSEYTKLTFPKTVRLRTDPPLANQAYYMFTFVPSKNATPDSDGCFGVMKFRGSFPTPREAEEWGENLIRNVDSYHENIIGYVGREFPLTLESKYCLSTKEVDIRTKMDSVSRENIKSHRENDKREMEEIQERQRQLLDDTKKDCEAEDLESYIQLRVKIASARMLREECEKKIKECNKSLKNMVKEVDRLDESFPEYKEEYKAKYKSAMEAIGSGGGDTDKMISYMKV